MHSLNRAVRWHWSALAIGLTVALFAGLLAFSRSGGFNFSLLTGAVTGGKAPAVSSSLAGVSATLPCPTCNVTITNTSTPGTLQNGVVNLLAFTATAPAGNDVMVDSFNFSIGLSQQGALITAYRLKDATGAVVASFTTPVNVSTIPMTVNRVISRGTSLAFTLEADVSNVNPLNALKVQLVPAGVVARCLMAGTATGGASNKLENRTAGTLTGFSEGNPAADIVITGSSQVHVARYRFHAQNEAYNIRKLTVINDATGAFDTPVDTGAITNVTIRYTDYTGRQRVVGNGSLSGGTVTITPSPLGIEITRNGDVYVDILADVITRSGYGEDISGKTFRLGILDTFNGASPTLFEAIGIDSQVVMTNNVTIQNGSAVNSYVVRTTKPTFAKLNSSQILASGENTLYAFTVSANAGGAVSFGRLVFDVTVNGLTDLLDDVGRFRLFRGATELTSEIRVSVAGPRNSNNYAQLVYAGTSAMDAPLSAINSADGLTSSGVANGTYKIIIAFAQEETISAGTLQNYYLRADVIGSSRVTDTITTRFSPGDEATGVSGLTVNNGNSNTGRIYELVSDFQALISSARNIIWSDKSADSHSYPVFNSRNFGSYDWTNGYLLKSDRVSAQTLTFSSSALGLLNVNTNINLGSYRILNSNNRAVGIGSGVAPFSFGLPAGAYTVTANPAPGYRTPNPYPVLVQAGQTATVSLTYVP